MSQVAKWMKDLYRKQLEEAARKQSSENIGNRYPWQISEAIDVLLSDAKPNEQVRIISGRLPKEFYRPDLISKLQGCLERGCHVTVIIWNAGAMPARVSVSELDSHDNFEIRSAHGTRPGIIPFHFLTIGERAYRLESPHEDYRDRTFTELSPEIPATICFNDSDTVKTLNRYFDDIWASCASSAPEHTREE